MPMQQQKPMTLDELLALAGQGAIGQEPKLLSPTQQGYAPGGPQISFTGGSPFPVNENPAILQNGAVLFANLMDAIKKMRQGPAGAPPGPASAPGATPPGWPGGM